MIFQKKNTTNILIVILLSIILFPISLIYLFMWSFAELLREPNDDTIWNKNPFDIF